jgi:catechol 2,3-dioxygenase-like lactoylglutathione lyase family enzyme
MAGITTTGTIAHAATPIVAVEGFFHAGITVSDMDASIVFYRDLLGFQLETDVIVDDPYVFTVQGWAGDSARVVFLRPADSETYIELLEYRGIERHSAAARPWDPGNGHVCLFVSNIEDAHRRLKEAGVYVRSQEVIVIPVGPRRGAKVMYCLDPDGYNVELFERPASWGGFQTAED